jgi:hypothetical protein
VLLICALFNDAVSSSDYIALGGRINNESERIWKETVAEQFKVLPSIRLEGLKKTSVRTAGFWAKIGTRGLPSSKQEC